MYTKIHVGYNEVVQKATSIPLSGKVLRRWQPLPTPATQPDPAGRVKATLRQIPVDRIDPDPNQPRKEFTEDELTELATSMRNLGQLQPVLVRVNPNDAKRFLLVVGERRWRAAQLAGLPTLTATVTKLNSLAAFIAQVAENVNRKDMTPMEEAAAYAKLAVAEWETDKIAQLFGKSAAYVGWRIDLLTLVPEAQDAVNKRILPINTAWYICQLAPETQRVFLKKWAHGDFPSAREAEAFAKARKAIEDQGELFTPALEAQLTEEQREQVTRARKKLVGDLDKLSMVGELLLTLANADPAELARLLAGADGGVGAYLARMEHLCAVTGKAAGVLRKAKAIAAATTLTLDFEEPVEAEESEASVEIPADEGELAESSKAQPEEAVKSTIEVADPDADEQTGDLAEAEDVEAEGVEVSTEA